MDPFSAEGELVNLHDAFHQGLYNAVLDFDTSSLSQTNQLPAQIIKYRARIMLGQSEKVLSEIRPSESTPDLAAIRILAAYQSGDGSAVRSAQQLAESAGHNASVQILCASVLASEGQVEDALKLLEKHQGSLDAVALIVQIYLQQNRLDLAQKEAQNARSWAQDSLLVNLAESWVGMREGGDAYQRAYYVFSELAASPSTASSRSLLAQALSELHLGRLEEAQAALQQVAKDNPVDADALANMVVLQTIMGGDFEGARKQLEQLQKEHLLLKDLASKRNAFEDACKKYSPRFEPLGGA